MPHRQIISHYWRNTVPTSKRAKAGFALTWTLDREQPHNSTQRRRQPYEILPATVE